MPHIRGVEGVELALVIVSWGELLLQSLLNRVLTMNEYVTSKATIALSV